MTAQQVRRHPKGTPSGGRFAPNPAAAAAEVAAPPANENWDAVLRPPGGAPYGVGRIRAISPFHALAEAFVVLGFSTQHASVTSVERDADGREWHVMSRTGGERVAVSPVGSRRNSVKPFTSTAGGLKARFEYHANSGGWGYTAGEARTNLADCPATNVIAQAERQRMALGQVCADLLNEGRITRAELPKFHGALIRSTKNPYRPPTWAGNPEMLLLALARAGCAAQIASVLPGNVRAPDNKVASRVIYDINTSGMPMPRAWKYFLAHPAMLAEAAETAPRSSTPADGTLLGSVHNRPGADPQTDGLGAWAAETVHYQKKSFTYGLGVERYYADSHQLESLKYTPLSFICTSPEPIPKGRGRIPCGVAETLLFDKNAELSLNETTYEMPHYPTARLQIAAARRSELAAHLAVGGRYPAHHSVVDALLDDPRNDWCATESEFRRKIVTAAVSQTAEPADSLNSRTDRLIAEHVIGGPSEEVTETELRCLRTVLNRRCRILLPGDTRFTTDWYQDEQAGTPDNPVGQLTSAPYLASRNELPMPETAARVSARLTDYTRAVNRLRKRSTEGAFAGRMFLQTLLTLPNLPLEQQAKLYVLERAATIGFYKQTAPGP